MPAAPVYPAAKSRRRYTRSRKRQTKSRSCCELTTLQISSCIMCRPKKLELALPKRNYKNMDRRLTISLLFVSFLSLSSITTNAQNWPSFRGPNASGVAEGSKPPLTWDVDKSTNVLWKTSIPGLSHASPIVWDNQIFVITAVSSNPKPTFVAKDRGIGLATDDVKHTWMIYALDKLFGRCVCRSNFNHSYPRVLLKLSN